MSRPVRIEYPGAHYHVTSKGIDQRAVFLDDEDRAVFLNVIDNVVSRFGWLLHGYVLMADHYHLVVEVPGANLSKGMRQLNGVYTQHFNRRHQTDGSLFQGRFRSILFEPDNYLLPLCRHVVLNPVRVGSTGSAHSWRWSSYRATAGSTKLPGWLHVDAILGSFGKRTRDSQKKYKEYIKAGIGEESPLDDRSNQVLLGSPAFLNEMQPILNGEKLAKRGPKPVRRRRSLAALFKNVADKPRTERNELIRRAHIEHSYTLMEIGDHLGLHYTTVSKVVNR
ncbi:MAG TPA: transposase [Pseudomonadales bacterium]|nr:transposase [Pseudomonadales bacterium]